MIPAILSSPSAQLVAVASRDPEKARGFADRFGCEPVGGYEGLLKRDDIEAIYMPLPTGLHREWVERCVDYGKHVLVEKSFASNLDEASDLVALTRPRGLLVQENFLFPLHRQFQRIKSILDEGEVGDLLLLRSTFGFPHLDPSGFRYDHSLGGGALLDAGAYVLKIAQLLLGPEVNVEHALLFHDSAIGVDVRGHATLTNPAGLVAQVSFGFGQFYQCTCELLGTRGKLTANRVFTAPPGYQPTLYLERQDHRQEINVGADDQYTKMVETFCGQVCSGEGFEDNLTAMLHQASLLSAVREKGIA